MGYPNEVALAAERIWAREKLQPARPSAQRRLVVNVLFTSVPATVSALRSAAALAAQLSADIRLLVAQVVPYPLPLSSPPVLIGFNENRFRTLAESASVKTDVQIYLCRDWDHMVTSTLIDQSVVVLGVRRRSWFSREMRLARTLRRAGHEVLITEVN